MAVGPLDLTNSTRTAFTYSMDKKESSRQYLVRRAKDELEEACATEHHDDEISGEQFARNILNCLDLYQTLLGKGNTDDIIQTALDAMGKVTRQWGHTQWAVEIHGIVKEKWDHDVLNEHPETGFGDVQDDEVEDVPARATRAARQTTARGKDLQTAPQKAFTENVSDRQTRASLKAKNATTTGITREGKGEQSSGEATTNTAPPAVAYTVDDLVSGMLTEADAVPFHAIEEAMGGQKLPYTQRPLNKGMTLRSVRKLLAEVEHDIAVKQWQAHSLRSLEGALMRLNAEDE